ncbi:MAG: aminoacyl-tRNA hydrolase [Bacteroidetes bacterium]|jgi:PTH1 family peptidyl-tRNA hydrolase|nr:aminoacyl-tRNA hydrolase [Bacteroidota bacterium]
MLLVAGLGNPGAAYERTRHNIGFLVVEELARRAGVRFRPGQGPWQEARFNLEGTDALLIEPTTYMNRSGLAVADAAAAAGVTPAASLVIFDDFQIPLGMLRLRLQGSDGGHNGMASVLEEFGTLEVPRLRCGIGSSHMPDDKDRMADYVLERFARDEVDAVRQMVGRAADAVRTVMRSGWNAAMNEFNRPLPGMEATPEV